MTRLVIHIGSEKTGSTAIQAFLFRNHQTLHKHGVNYLRKGRRAHAHNRILQARRSETLSEIMSEIVEEIQSKPDHTHVLPSELYLTLRAISQTIFPMTFVKEPKCWPIYVARTNFWRRSINNGSKTEGFLVPHKNF